MIHIYKSRQMVWNAFTTYVFDKSLGPIPLSVYAKKLYYNGRSKSIKIVFLWSKKAQNIVPSLSISISVMVCLLKCLSSHDAIIVKNPRVSESRKWVELRWCGFVSKKKRSIFWPFRTRCLDWSSGDRFPKKVDEFPLKLTACCTAPENGWLEYYSFPFGMTFLSGVMSVVRGL